jgi:hypothetical protein
VLHNRVARSTARFAGPRPLVRGHRAEEATIWTTAVDLDDEVPTGAAVDYVIVRNGRGNGRPPGAATASTLVRSRSSADGPFDPWG